MQQPGNHQDVGVWGGAETQLTPFEPLSCRQKLVVAAQVVLHLGFGYFWVDSVCIDQESHLEKQRERTIWERTMSTAKCVWCSLEVLSRWRTLFCQMTLLQQLSYDAPSCPQQQLVYPWQLQVVEQGLDAPGICPGWANHHICPLGHAPRFGMPQADRHQHN